MLYPALLKRAAMEVVLQRSVELGVHSIQPVKASRSIPDSDAVNRRRWETIVREASMQSHRYEIPALENPTRLNELTAFDESPIIVLTTDAAQMDLKSWIESRSKQPQSISIIIGPEGGWTRDEQDLFFQKDWAQVSFGESILRADTASLGVLSALRYAYHTLS
jgi:16S rRNA (uracil1498-N3)-methyltransferase